MARNDCVGTLADKDLIGEKRHCGMKAGTKIVIEVLSDGTKFYEVSNGENKVHGQIVFGSLEDQIQLAVKEVEE